MRARRRAALGWYLRQPIHRFRDVNDFLTNAPRRGQMIYIITNNAQAMRCRSVDGRNASPL
jgi:hypothetical protein